jgi:hypothetical protein
MNNFMKTIISAIKYWVKDWVKNDAFTAEDALDIALKGNFVEPLAAVDGTIYTTPNGDIYTL